MRYILSRNDDTGVEMSDEKELSRLEHEVMQVLWQRGQCSAEDVRDELQEQRPLAASTVRTLLKRMEEKGFVTHRAVGRGNLYRQAMTAQHAAARAARKIVDRFCGGSVEALLVGMVDDELLEPDQLRALAARIQELQTDGSPSGEQQ